MVKSRAFVVKPLNSGYHLTTCLTIDKLLKLSLKKFPYL